MPTNSSAPAVPVAKSGVSKIVGGVLGGVIGAAAAVIGGAVWNQRRKQRAAEQEAARGTGIDHHQNWFSASGRNAEIAAPVAASELSPALASQYPGLYSALPAPRGPIRSGGHASKFMEGDVDSGPAASQHSFVNDGSAGRRPSFEEAVDIEDDLYAVNVPAFGEGSRRLNRGARRPEYLGDVSSPSSVHSGISQMTTEELDGAPPSSISDGSVRQDPGSATASVTSASLGIHTIPEEPEPEAPSSPPEPV